jgi:hypothetical protein
VSDEDFRTALEDLIKRNATDLTADDLRGVATDLDDLADQWEGISL